MFYYQFNIGDYQSHTGHLSEMEDLAYRRLLDWCYLHERPLPGDLDEIARLIRMRSHSDCIATVLREFFQRIEDGWVSVRVMDEIGKVNEKSIKASASAKARWAEKPSKINGSEVDANAMRTHSERNATQDTRPKTQDTKPNKNKAVVTAAPEGVSLEVWDSFLQQRKASRAVVTPTVVKKIAQEAQKAGWTLENALAECAARGWRGFKADWVAEKQQKNVGERNRDTMQGLTRGLIGGGKNVQLLK
jgi:uncharacterized protein YdaU (DUF1376 family)